VRGVEHDEHSQGVEALGEGVRELLAEAFLQLGPGGDGVDHPGNGAEPHDRVPGDVGQVGDAGEGEQVVLADGAEIDVPDHDDLAELTRPCGHGPGPHELDLVHAQPGEQFGVEVGDAPRGRDEARSPGVLADGRQDLGHGRGDSVAVDGGGTAHGDQSTSTRAGLLQWCGQLGPGSVREGARPAGALARAFLVPVQRSGVGRPCLVHTTHLLNGGPVMTNTNLDEILGRSRPATAENDPDLLALVAPMSDAARTEVREASRSKPGSRRPGRPLLAVALGGSLVLGGGAFVESLQPGYEARATIAFALPGDPFIDNGDSAPTRCLAGVRFDVSGGAAAQDHVEEAVEGSDWSALESRLAALVQSGRGETGLGQSVVDTLDTGIRSTLDPQLVGSARYGGASLTCGVTE